MKWVNRYLKAESNQAYQYTGKDVYAARCALLHSYGSVSTSHFEKNPPKKFGYVDNGPHQVDAKTGVALISVAQLTHDFGAAVASFMRDVSNDMELKAKVDSRMPMLMRTISIQGV